MNLLDRIFWTKWKSERLSERDLKIFILYNYTEDWTPQERKALLDWIIILDRAIWI